MAGFTPKQWRFITEYLLDLNATQAATRAGYSAKTANQQGSALLANLGIRQEIDTLKAAQLAKNDLTANRVLEEMRRLAFSDVRGFFDEQGNLKAVHELTPEQGATLASVEVVKKNIAAGDGHVDTIHKLKTWDKTRSLEMLAKHFGLLMDRLQVDGTVEITWKTADADQSPD